MTCREYRKIMYHALVTRKIPDDTEIEFQVMELPCGLKNGGGVNQQINMIIHLPERLTVLVLQTKKLKEEG